MAISVVHATNASKNVTSITTTTDVAVDDIVIAASSCNNQAASSFSDNLGHTWLQVPTIGSIYLSIYWTRVTTAGSMTVTAGTGGSSAAIAMVTTIITGASTTQSLTSSADEVSSTGTTTGPSLVTPAAVGDLVISLTGINGPTGDTLTGDSDTTGGSWSAVTSNGTSGQGATSNARAAVQTKTVTSTAQQSHSMTITARTARDISLAIQQGVSVTPKSSSDTSSISIADSGSLPPPPAQAVIESWSAVGGSSAVATMTADKPTGTSSGDRLYAFCWSNNTTASWTPPSGWTSGPADSSIGCAWFSLNATGSEPSTFDFTRSNSVAAGGVVLIRVSSPGTTDDWALVSLAGQTFTLPAVTGLSENTVYLQVGTNSTTNATSWTPPAGTTELADTTSTGNANVQFFIGYDVIGAGSSGTRAWTKNNFQNSRGGVVAIAGGSGPVTKSSSDSATLTISEVSSVDDGTGTTFKNGTDSLSLAVAESHATNPLATFKQALADRETSRVNVGVLGCSLVEGYPVDAEKTIEEYLAAKLRTFYPINDSPSGYGYVGLPSSAMVGINPWTITPGTSGTVGTANAANGWGGHHQSWYTAPAAIPPILVLDVTQTGGPWTSFDLNLLRVSTYSTTGGKYRIDGGSWVTFSLASASSISVDKLHVNSPVTSTIEITIDPAATGSFLIVNGITGYNGDESKGIQVHNFGHSGFRVNQWRTSTQPGNDYRYDILNEDLDLLIFQDLGVNDAQTLSSAEFRTDLIDFISYLKEVLDVPMVMVAVQDLSNSVSYEEPWENYVAVLKEVADANGMKFFTYEDKIPEPPGDLYYTDDIHGATDGSMYDLMAEKLLFAITDSAWDTSAISIAETSDVEITDSGPTPISSSDTTALTITEKRISDNSSAIVSSASLSEFSDDFNDGIIDGWFTQGTVTESSGKLNLQANAGNTSAMSTVSYQVSNSSLVIEFSSFATGTTDIDLYLEGPTASGFVEMYFNEGDSTAQILFNNGSASTDVPWNNTYKWIKIDFSGDEFPLVTVSKSQDGINWTVMASQTSIFSGSYARLWFSLFSTNASYGYSVNGINGSPSIVPVSGSDTASVSVSESRSLAASLSRSDTSSLTITESSNAGASLPGAETIALGITETKAMTVGVAGSESSSIGISDSSTTKNIITKSDTSSISIGESISPAVSLSRTDTSAVSVSDSSAAVKTVFVSATDTQSISLNDSSNSSSTLSRTDTSSLTITETRSGSNTVGTSDSSSVTITEVSNPSSTLPGSESISIGFVETSAIAVTSSTADTSSITASDSSNSALSLSRTDTSSVAVSDIGSSLLTEQTSDSSSVAISETTSVSIFTLVSRVDDLSMYVDDSASIAGEVVSGDTSGLSLSENTSGAQDNTIDGTDISSIVVDETTNILVTVATSDSPALVITDEVELYKTIPTADSSDLTITEMAGLFQNSDLPGTDATAVGITEQAGIFIVFGATDSGSVGTDETVSESITVTSSDARGVTAEEYAEIAGTLSRTETVPLGISESKTLIITAEFGSSDSSGVGIDESRVIQTTQVGSDSSAITIDDSGIIVTGSGITTSDTSAFAISDTGSIIDLLPRQPWVYVNGEWTTGVFKVYRNGQWTQFAVRIYSGGIWT